MEAKETTHRQVPAVTKAIGILRKLGNSIEPMGVNQVARELDLIPSTCLHILRVLAAEGLVAFDPVSKRYSIDVGILPIARNAIQKNNFVNTIEDKLTELSIQYGVTCIATQISEPNHMIVVAISQATSPFRLQVDLGNRFPTLISATGRCFAAFSDIKTSDLKKRFATLNWDCPPSFEQWKLEIDETKKNGYAIDKGNYISGVSIIAVPFFNQNGQITKSIVAIGISEKIDAIGVKKIGTNMMSIRDEVTKRMFSK